MGEKNPSSDPFERQLDGADVLAQLDEADLFVAATTSGEMQPDGGAQVEEFSDAAAAEKSAAIAGWMLARKLGISTDWLAILLVLDQIDVSKLELCELDVSALDSPNPANAMIADDVPADPDEGRLAHEKRMQAILDDMRRHGFLVTDDAADEAAKRLALAFLGQAPFMHRQDPGKEPEFVVNIKRPDVPVGEENNLDQETPEVGDSYDLHADQDNPTAEDEMPDVLPDTRLWTDESYGQDDPVPTDTLSEEEDIFDVKYREIDPSDSFYVRPPIPPGRKISRKTRRSRATVVSLPYRLPNRHTPDVEFHGRLVPITGKVALIGGVSFLVLGASFLGYELSHIGNSSPAPAVSSGSGSPAGESPQGSNSNSQSQEITCQPYLGRVEWSCGHFVVSLSTAPGYSRVQTPDKQFHDPTPLEKPANLGAYSVTVHEQKDGSSVKSMTLSVERK